MVEQRAHHLSLVVDKQDRHGQTKPAVYVRPEKNENTLILVICECGAQKIMTVKQQLTYNCACMKKML